MALNPQNRGKGSKLPVHPDFGSLTDPKPVGGSGKMSPSSQSKGIRVERRGKRTMIRFPKKSREGK